MPKETRERLVGMRNKYNGNLPACLTTMVLTLPLRKPRPKPTFPLRWVCANIEYSILKTPLKGPVLGSPGANVGEQLTRESSKRFGQLPKRESNACLSLTSMGQRARNATWISSEQSMIDDTIALAFINGTSRSHDSLFLLKNKELFFTPLHLLLFLSSLLSSFLSSLSFPLYLLHSVFLFFLLSSSLFNTIYNRTTKFIIAEEKEKKKFARVDLTRKFVLCCGNGMGDKRGPPGVHKQDPKRPKFGISVSEILADALTPLANAYWFVFVLFDRFFGECLLSFFVCSLVFTFALGRWGARSWSPMMKQLSTTFTRMNSRISLSSMIVCRSLCFSCFLSSILFFFSVVGNLGLFGELLVEIFWWHESKLCTCYVYYYSGEREVQTKFAWCVEDFWNKVRWNVSRCS